MSLLKLADNTFTLAIEAPPSAPRTVHFHLPGLRRSATQRAAGVGTYFRTSSSDSAGGDRLKVGARERMFRWACNSCFRRVIIVFVAELTRRKLLAGSVPVLGGAAVLHSAVPHRHPWDAEARADDQHAGHGSGPEDGGHAGFRDGRTVDHAA